MQQQGASASDSDDSGMMTTDPQETVQSEPHPTTLKRAILASSGSSTPLSVPIGNTIGQYASGASYPPLIPGRNGLLCYFDATTKGLLRCTDGISYQSIPATASDVPHSPAPAFISTTVQKRATQVPSEFANAFADGGELDGPATASDPLWSPPATSWSGSGGRGGGHGGGRGGSGRYGGWSKYGSDDNSINKYAYSSNGGGGGSHGGEWEGQDCGGGWSKFAAPEVDEEGGANKYAGRSEPGRPSKDKRQYRVPPTGLGFGPAGPPVPGPFGPFPSGPAGPFVPAASGPANVIPVPIEINTLVGPDGSTTLLPPNGLF
ncbi:hypothetical protein BGZ54_007217 [Gamsiella multidivaricata]|nr:hypothetical protein BGZ54_007217 [Gamsiella multidivaricata]